MEIGPLKSDNAVKLAQYTKYPHFIDDTPLQDTSYNVDALSMHCMSDFPIPISRKAGSPMMTAGPMASFLPLAFIKSTSVAKKLQGNFLLFPSWLHLEKAFEQYSIQGNTVYTNTIHSLSKYHRSHVEAAPANYIQQNSQGWKQRSVSLLFYSTPLPLYYFAFLSLTHLSVYFLFKPIATATKHPVIVRHSINKESATISSRNLGSSPKAP